MSRGRARQGHADRLPSNGAGTASPFSYRNHFRCLASGALPPSRLPFVRARRLTLRFGLRPCARLGALAAQVAAGRLLGSIRHEYECGIGQFKGPKLQEYCKSACPKYEQKPKGSPAE